MFVQLTREYLGKPPGERIDVSDADARHLVDSGVAVAVADDPIGPAVGRAFENALGRFSTALDGAVDNALKQFVKAQGRSHRHASPLIFGKDGSDPKGMSFGDWLLCVRRNDAKRLADVYDSRLADWGEGKAALATPGGTIGGYSVPTDFLPRLLQAAAEQAVVRPRATVVPMTSRSIQVPYLDVTNAPTAGDTAFFGAVVARWAEEAAPLNETEPIFRQLELVAHELSGYSLISNALLADNAIGLEQLLVRIFGGAIAWFEDYAFLRGDGVGKPLGVANAPAALSVTRNTGGQFKLVDAGTMLGKLLPGWSPATTCWVIHPTVIAQMVQMVSAAAGVGWLDNLREKMPMQLLGLPVCISEKLPALGTAKDVLLVDFQHYLIGDRQQVEVAYSEHFKFTNNQGTWRFVSRIDGQPWLRGSITLADATSTVSPYVYLT
ncbi:MAG: phage major capsid protein [Planctomycetes bacterium]|nr:phage major capsid protein [Planctomycetota bacterium]